MEPELQNIAFFQSSHLAAKVAKHLPKVDHPGRPSGLMWNVDGLLAFKDTGGFFLMTDVLVLPQPVTSHVLAILMTSWCGRLKQLAYTRVKMSTFNGQEIHRPMAMLLEWLRGKGMGRQVLALVSDENAVNAQLAEFGYPLLADLRHLERRLSGVGHADQLLTYIYGRATFSVGDWRDKWAQAQHQCEQLPAEARRITALQMHGMRQVLEARFRVSDQPFRFAEANNDLLEGVGKKWANVVKRIGEETGDAMGEVERHKFVRRVVGLLTLTEQLGFNPF
ncbi:uncharacterized protein [Drosophila takahashii]|uniref:uncharacterized protein n=1 Tax=Drosophila takahashii TaxID=29030 RepID=UPI003899130F